MHRKEYDIIWSEGQEGLVSRSMQELMGDAGTLANNF